MVRAEFEVGLGWAAVLAMVGWWSCSSPWSATPGTCSSGRPVHLARPIVRRHRAAAPLGRGATDRRPGRVRFIGVFAWPLSGLLAAAARVVAT